MSELLQSELLRRLAELELRVDLLSKALAELTAQPKTHWVEVQPWQQSSSEGGA